MTSDDEEEDRRMRAAALQNASAIQAAKAQAERELAREREWLRITLASIGDAVICTDSAGRIAFMNGVAEQLTGWPQGEAAGRPLPEVFRILDEFTRKELESPALRAIREGAVVTPPVPYVVLVARDGKERPVDDSTSPMRDEGGVPIGAVVVFRDVSERRAADETRARLAAIVESSDDAIVGKTLDGIIRTWNAGAERLFGYAAAEAIGRHITLIIPPERYDEEQSIINRLINGERIDHFETVRVRKDGGRIDISITVSPLRDAGGRVIGASKIARDITERKERERRKDEFLATLSHELRNPLAPLRNGLQIIRNVLQHDDRFSRTLAMMDRQLGHMVRLIEDLMDLSRVSSGKVMLRLERITLRSVLDSAFEAARPAVEAGGHTFSAELPGGRMELDADSTRLVQVFGNLLQNAAKYTPPAGRIRVTAEADVGWAIVRVSDSGVGIPPEMLPKVFDLFTQVGSALDRAQGGLGIGLTLVKRLVELHGGTVAAESPGLGLGSTFTVRLPLASPVEKCGSQPSTSLADTCKR